MGIFKDLKEDFSDAVDELVPGGDSIPDEDSSKDVPLDTTDDNIDVKDELNKLDGLLQKASKKAESGDASVFKAEANAPEKKYEKEEKAPEKDIPEDKEDKLEEKLMDQTAKENVSVQDSAPVSAAPLGQVSDEVALITSGMQIKGDLNSTGSISVEGVINGNVQCNGKLTVTGTINGNSSASEFFADSAHIQGEVSSTGTVKVGNGSVIVGNISATSAVIAGAVKGDIDVQGPVVVDTSAVVMGNIKSRSVQINNGAVIEGFCSQAYADIDVAAIFDEEEKA